MSSQAPTVLLTLGRLPKALDLARCFHGAGCRVIIAEPFAWHLSRASRSVARAVTVMAPNVDAERYRSEILDVIRREGVELVVPVSEEAMHVVLIEGDLPAGVRLFSAPAACVREQHDKWAFVQIAASSGLLVPETALVGTLEAAQLCERHDTVVKPVFSCSGTEVQLLRRGEPLPPKRPEAEPLLVQRRLTGTHRSSLAVCHQGRVLGQVTYRGTLFSGTVAAAFERIDAPDIDAWVHHFAAHTAWCGFLAFDFIDDDSGAPHAIECNPRVTSGVHFFEPQALAKAVLQPDACQELIPFRAHARLHQFYTTLTETQGALFSARWARWREGVGTVLSHRDVTWKLTDPWPFLLMTPLSLPIIYQSIKDKISLGEAATRDIARLSRHS